MKRVLLASLAFAAAAIAIVAIAAGGRDGAVIRNSGSTNTAGYIIKVWSDGQAEVTMRGALAPRSFTVNPSIAKSFFTDVKAARANPGTPGHCMKSASFGTVTTVLWHSWASSDLQCPPYTAPMQALLADVRAIEQAGNISSAPRRTRIPLEPRMIPSTAPEVSPT